MAQQGCLPRGAMRHIHLDSGLSLAAQLVDYQKAGKENRISVSTSTSALNSLQHTPLQAQHRTVRNTTAYPPYLIVLSSQWSKRAEQLPPDSATTLLLPLSRYNAPLPPSYLYAAYSYLLPATQCYDNGEAKLAGQRHHKGCKLMGGVGEERKWLAEKSRGLWQPGLKENTI